MPQQRQHAGSEPETEELSSFQTRPKPVQEPQTTLEWLYQSEADVAAVERAITREHQAAIGMGQPWPPVRQPHADTGPGTSPETALLITDAIADVEQAAQFLREEQASRQARSDYAARISREAEAQPEAHATLTAEVPAGAEIEL